MTKSISAFFMSIAIALFNLVSPAVPETKPMDEIAALSDILEEHTLPDEIYVLDSATFATIDERHMAISLQGIVAKTVPQIFIKTNGMDSTYLSEIEKSGIKLLYKDENGEDWTLEKLLNKFSSLIADSGYVLYRESENAEGLNMATNLATVKGWLPVPQTLEDMAKNSGLTMKEDLSDDKYDVLFQWKYFSLYKKHFSGKAMCHLKYEVTGLRDLAIQQGFFVFFVDETDFSSFFRKRVMQYFGDNTPMLGWINDEVKFVDEASATGNMIFASDHSHNNSILASFNCYTPKQKAVKDTYNDPSKHYCALVYSDGDNMQWIQNGFSAYFQKLALENNFPITWSFPPLLQDFSPATVKAVYEAASTDDYFMAGVSGSGYMHPTQYPLKAMEGFTDMTAASMKASDLSYFQVLDITPEDELDDTRLMKRLEYYTRYDNIAGGILSLDPDKYAGGKGRIFFVDDKPFITYRFSLWHTESDGTAVTEEWLNEQAETVNSYPADINSINGYSVINIHPWSISTENLSYFVSQLDDGVVLVTVDELLTMISQNIPHENASPEQ